MRRLLHLRKVLKDFWLRFSKTYQNELHQMNIYRKPRSASKESISVGDVVPIKKDDESVPRCQWRLRKILHLVIIEEGDNNIVV